MKRFVTYIIILLIAVGITVVAWQFYSVESMPIPEEQETEERVLILDSPIETAVEADHLDVSNCALSPEVMKVKIGSSIKVKNDGSDPIELVMAFQPVMYKIQAKSTQDLRIDFGGKAGRYNYFCFDGGKENPNGIFEVVE